MRRIFVFSGMFVAFVCFAIEQAPSYKGQVSGSRFRVSDSRVNDFWGDKDTGGPDAFGYTYIDSDEPGGPSYNWIDITGVGTSIPALDFINTDDTTYVRGDDGVAGPFPIGFTFTYYWYQVDSFYIDVNGAISFSDNTTYAPQWGESGGTTEIPSDYPPNDLVIPLGGDLTMVDAAGTPLDNVFIYYWSNNIDTLIVSWINLPEWGQTGTSGTHTVQLILSKNDSSITFNYGPQDGGLYTGNPQNAIGIENFAGTMGLQYLENGSPSENMFEDSLTIKISYPETPADCPDIGVVEHMSKDNKGFFVHSTTELTPWVKIENTGNTVLTDFKVYCKIYRGGPVVYFDSTTCASISPGEKDSLVFPNSYTVTTQGTYSALGYCNLPGDIYEPNNDMMVEFSCIDYPGYLTYDDGEPEMGWAFYDAGRGWANKFTPPTTPCKINILEYCLITGGKPTAEFIPMILDDDGPDESPGTILYADTITDEIDRYVPVDISSYGIIIPDGSFYVAYIQAMAYPGCPYLACDTTPPFARQAWVGSPDSWGEDNRGEDWAIRAYVTDVANKDVALVTINSPEELVIPEQALTPQIVVGNCGKDVASFITFLDIDSSGINVYADSDSVIGLVCGEQRDVNFSDWMPGNSGVEYEVTAYVVFEGDENPANDTITKTVGVAGGDFLIWDPDGDASSGPVVSNLLESGGYQGSYTTELSDYYGYLSNFTSIFVFCGAYQAGSYKIGETSTEAGHLVQYLTSGKNLYLEGGDVWYYNPGHGGYNFNTLFGDTAIKEGGDVTALQGQAGALTEGMTFSYTGPTSYLDYVESNGCAIAFRDTAGKGRGHYYVGPDSLNNYRTWGLCFEFSGLQDVKTQEALIDTIMHFFGVVSHGIEETENPKSEIRNPKLTVYPNPFTTVVSVQWLGISEANLKVCPTIQIYDLSGRLVKTLTTNHLPLTPAVTWDGTDNSGNPVASGLYFCRLETGKQTLTKKLTLIR